MQSARSDAVAAGVRLVDAAHAVWMSAQLECADARQARREAAPGRRASAHIVYRAALDREEAAARDLESLSPLATMSAAA